MLIALTTGNYRHLQTDGDTVTEKANTIVPFQLYVGTDKVNKIDKGPDKGRHSVLTIGRVKKLTEPNTDTNADTGLWYSASSRVDIQGFNLDAPAVEIDRYKGLDDKVAIESKNAKGEIVWSIKNGFFTWEKVKNENRYCYSVSVADLAKAVGDLRQYTDKAELLAYAAKVAPVATRQTQPKALQRIF